MSLPTYDGRARQISITMPAQVSSETATNASMFSVPNRDTPARVTRPPTIQPRMAPLPMNPNERLASRVVITWLASVQTCDGASTEKTPTHR